MTFYYTRARAREAMRYRMARAGPRRHIFARGRRFYGQFYSRTRGGANNYMRARAYYLGGGR